MSDGSAHVVFNITFKPSLSATPLSKKVSFSFNFTPWWKISADSTFYLSIVFDSNKWLISSLIGVFDFVLKLSIFLFLPTVKVTLISSLAIFDLSNDMHYVMRDILINVKVSISNLTTINEPDIFLWNLKGFVYTF